MLRLAQARRALLSADSRRITVTEIATCFGFVELGRFSVEYRKMFGESPSQTLHYAFPGNILKINVKPKGHSPSDASNNNFELTFFA
jgi:AraC-like DNA-binding protein